MSRTLVGGGLFPLQRCSQCILLPQPTGQRKKYAQIDKESCSIKGHNDVSSVAIWSTFYHSDTSQTVVRNTGENERNTTISLKTNSEMGIDIICI